MDSKYGGNNAEFCKVFNSEYNKMNEARAENYRGIDSDDSMSDSDDEAHF